MGRKLGSLSYIAVHGSPYASSGTRIKNNTSAGIIISDGVASVVTTGDTAEMTLSKSGDNKKINYTRLIFKGARAAETDGSDAWGGRSVIGNTTTDNIVAVDSGTYTFAYVPLSTATILSAVVLPMTEPPPHASDPSVSAARAPFHTSRLSLPFL